MDGPRSTRTVGTSRQIVPPRPDLDAPWDRMKWPMPDLLVGTLAPFGITLLAEIMLLGIVGLHGGGAGVLLTAIQQLSLAVVPLWWIHARTGSIAPLGLRRRGWRPADVFAGIGTGIGALLLGAIVIAITSAVIAALTGHAPLVDNPVHSFGDRWLLPSALLAVLIAPICEELLFRGFVFGGLRTRLRFRWAALLSGVLFGLVHADAVRFLGLAVMGIVIAGVYERRRTLVAAMTAHATVNLVAVLAFLATR
jgi:membrane protease YdiL (CAAX protease family)